jgi:hypothetical protein
MKLIKYAVCEHSISSAAVGQDLPPALQKKIEMSAAF